MEERKRAIERLPGRMTVLVDKVNREHRVRVLRDPERVALRRVDLDRFESVAELRAEAVEALAAGTRGPPVKRRPSTGTSRLLATARSSSERCRPARRLFPNGNGSDG